MHVLKTAALVGVLMIVTAIGRAEPLKLRVAYVVPVTNLASILSARDGISRHSGKSYVLDVYRFRGSTRQITALATGDLDIALLGFTSLPLAIENASMTDLRAVGEIRDGAPGYYSNKDSNAEIGHSTWVC